MQASHIGMLFFFPPAVDAQLDEVGVSFMKNSISAIETRGELQISRYEKAQFDVIPGKLMSYSEKIKHKIIMVNMGVFSLFVQKGAELFQF